MQQQSNYYVAMQQQSNYCVAMQQQSNYCVAMQQQSNYRLGMVNLKSFISKDFLWIKWKFELIYACNLNFHQKFELEISLN